MDVYEAFAIELRKAGVEKAFGLMGEEIANFIALLEEHSITYYSGRHEQGSVGMADGYARATGRLGVAILSRGPGITNAITAVKTAAMARTPMIVLAPVSAIGLKNPGIAIAAAKAPKHLDNEAIAAAAGITSVTLRSPATAVADFRAIIARASEGMTIMINLPPDVLNAPAGSDDTQVTLPVRPSVCVPVPASVSEAANLIEAQGASGRVVILAGRGAVLAGARSELERLGALTGALLGNSLMARGYFAGDSHNIGTIGGFSTPVARRLLRSADTILVFGATLNNFTTYVGELFPDAKIVQFDVDADAFGRYNAVDLSVLGDAGLAASALADELDRRGHRVPGFRDDGVAAEIAALDLSDTFDDQSSEGALDPRSIWLQLDRILPRERTAVVDAGHHMAFEAQYLQAPVIGSWIWPLQFSAVGTGLGVAIGVALGKPEQLTVVGIGDGGLMMHLAEIDTAARYGARLLVVVINDAAYGAEVQFMQIDGIPDRLARYEDRSFEDIARALGAEAATVRSLDQIPALAQWLQNPNGPLVIDFKVSDEVRGHIIDEWAKFAAPQAAALDR